MGGGCCRYMTCYSLIYSWAVAMDSKDFLTSPCIDLVHLQENAARELKYESGGQQIAEFAHQNDAC